MDFAQFGERERRNAVLLHQDAQLVPCVELPRSAGFDQRAACGLVLAEKTVSSSVSEYTHDEGQTE